MIYDSLFHYWKTDYQSKGLPFSQQGRIPQVTYKHINLDAGKRVSATGKVFYRGYGIKGVVSDPAKIKQLQSQRRQQNLFNKVKALNPDFSDSAVNMLMNNANEYYSTVKEFDKQGATKLYNELVSP